MVVRVKVNLEKHLSQMRKVLFRHEKEIGSLLESIKVLIKNQGRDK